MASAEMTAVEKSVGSTRTRFANDGEIYYCIASILKYAPFINKIFVITDNQRPKFINYFIMEGICDDKKIIFVNHTDIFGKNKNHYPTFNSLSIETMLWNIDNLSNSVIYFNDDVFLLSGVEKSDFISLEAKPILRGEFCPHPNLTTPWTIKSILQRLKRRQPLDTFGINQSNAAKIIGLDQYFRMGHYPHIIRPGTLAKFFSEQQEKLDRQLQYKFRSNEQFSAISIANHIEIENNQAEVLPLEKSCYIKPNTVSKTHLEAIMSEEVRFGCIQSLDQFSPKWRAATHETLRLKFDGYLPSPVSSR